MLVKVIYLSNYAEQWKKEADSSTERAYLPAITRNPHGGRYHGEQFAERLLKI
jgi:hypothetical protein